MKHKFLTLFAALAIALIPLGFSGTALAACGNGSSSKAQVLKGLGETGNNCDEDALINVIAGVVEILSIVVGIVALIAIIFAGFKYITSGGDSNKVSNAKQTLIYAIVGIIVAALAQVLVHFVLFEVNDALNKGGKDKNKSSLRLDSSKRV